MFKAGDYTNETFPCEILSTIPGGKMAQLFLAKLVHTEHLFAVKEADENASGLQKQILRREAAVLCRLCHRQLPKFFGYFEEADRCYYIMSYHAGENLEKLTARSMLSEKQIQYAVLHICEVLTYLHEKGLIYGDLKPSNLLWTPDGEIMLLDFGTAEFEAYIGRMAQKEPERFPLLFQGTMGYAAPECWHREHLTRQTDIFALGALLYYLLEGEEPKEHFGRFFLTDTKKKDRWQPVIDKCCALQADNRYESAAKVFDAVKKIRC